MKKFIVLSLLLFAVSACTPAYNNPDVPRPFKGGENASIVIEEFADFQCPACGQAYSAVHPLQEQYGDKVKWKFMHFPLTQVHPYAFNAAMAAECANDQGKFWEMHDKMFENQRNLNRSNLKKFAEEVGLDMELYNACFKSRAKSDQVNSDVAEAKKRDVNSTPTFYVNGQKIQNWGQLGSLIDTLLAQQEDGEDSESENTGE